MSALSEEDVLAHLVLWACRPVMTNCYSTAQQNERDAWNAAVGVPVGPNPVGAVAAERLFHAPSLAAAIVDTERRWEVELAREAVLSEVRRLRGDTFGPLGDAARRLVAAEAEIAHHAR